MKHHRPLVMLPKMHLLTLAWFACSSEPDRDTDDDKNSQKGRANEAGNGADTAKA